MVGGFGMTELLVILAIVLLIFGPKRIKSIGLGCPGGEGLGGLRGPLGELGTPRESQDRF